MRTLSGDGVRRQTPVVFFVEAPEVGALSGAPPGVVSPVPFDRESQSLGNRDGGLPAERPQLSGVERVSIVMARPVLHKVLKPRRLAAKAQNLIGDFDAADLGAGGDVVGAAWLALPEDPSDGAHVVVDIEVVADGRTVSIDRKGKVLQGIGDEQRNDLLRELVG